MCDKRRTLRDIARHIVFFFFFFFFFFFGAVQFIMTDNLGMSKVSARLVPRLLTKVQKKSRLEFLSISVISEKITLRNVCIEL